MRYDTGGGVLNGDNGRACARTYIAVRDVVI